MSSHGRDPEHQPESASEPRVPFPSDISLEEMVQHFSLSDKDRARARRCRGEQNRIGFALQLCHVRWKGRLATSFESVPMFVVKHVSLRLEYPNPPVMWVYPDRRQTRWEHNQAICKYLGLRLWASHDADLLREELMHRVEQGLRQAEMLASAEEILREWKLVLPGPSVIREVARSVATRIEDIAVATISKALDDRVIKYIESLLVVAKGRQSPLQELKIAPKRASPKNLVWLCERIETLEAAGVAAVDLSGVTSDRVADLADRVRSYSRDHLARFRAAKRRAFLACFLVETLKSSIDAAVRTFERLVIKTQGRVKDAIKEEALDFKGAARNELRTWVKAGGLLGQHRAHLTIADGVHAQLPPAEIDASVKRAEELIQEESSDRIEKLVATYRYTRKFTPALFAAVEFTPGPGFQDLVDAVDVLRTANRENRRKLPEDVPHSPCVVPRSWLPFVFNEYGEVNKGAYEVCVTLSLRDALGRGEIFVEGSRKYVSIASLVYPDEEWESRRAREYQRFGFPEDVDEYLAALTEQLARAARATDEGFPTNPFASIRRGRLKLAKEPAMEKDPEVEKLRDQLVARMPQVRIEQLLHDVDEATGFTEIFQPPPGYARRLSRGVLRKALLAGILAFGTNLGLWTMGRMARGVTYSQLAHVAEWYLKEVLISAANDHLVNQHHSHPLTKIWGEGRRSSSDGIRFGMAASSLLGEPNPKYFGWGDGLTSYKAMSDQWSIFSTQLISCHENEALRMVDALLSNQTRLPLGGGHATDTAGTTHAAFAMCHLLGYPIWPRTADLASVKLYKLDPQLALNHIEALFCDTAKTDVVRRQWDNVVRLAASLRDRLAPAHVLGRCLAASARSNPLASAVNTLGLIYETIYQLQYLDSPELRRIVRRLLARHESQNQLGRELAIGGRGEYRVGDYDAAVARAHCHTLIENAILYWNTCRLAEIVRQLRADGLEVHEERLAEISPLLFAHVNFRGSYDFMLGEE